MILTRAGQQCAFRAERHRVDSSYVPGQRTADGSASADVPQADGTGRADGGGQLAVRAECDVAYSLSLRQEVTGGLMRETSHK